MMYNIECLIILIIYFIVSKIICVHLQQETRFIVTGTPETEKCYASH